MNRAMNRWHIPRTFRQKPSWFFNRDLAKEAEDISKALKRQPGADDGKPDLGENQLPNAHNRLTDEERDLMRKTITPG